MLQRAERSWDLGTRQGASSSSEREEENSGETEVEREGEPHHAFGAPRRNESDHDVPLSKGG